MSMVFVLQRFRTGASTVAHCIVGCMMVSAYQIIFDKFSNKMNSYIRVTFLVALPVPESKVTLAVSLLFSAIICHLIWTRYHGGLHRIPGPFLASISSFWKWHVIWQEDMPMRSVHLHEKYGPLVRIGPNHVSASSPEAIRVIYVENRGFPKATTYGILQPQLDGYDLHNIFSTQDVEYHSVHKRIIGGLYTTSALKDVQNNIDRCTTLFVSQLEGLTRFQPTIVDMSAWLQFYAFDSLLDVMFSKQIGFLATGSDVDGICEFDHQMMVYFSIWSQVPKLERIISRWKSLTGSLKPNPLYSFILNLVDDRVSQPDESNDMLSWLLRLHRDTPDKLSVREVIGAVYINVIAAHDVTAITLRTVFYHLSRSPAIHRKLYDEIAEADRLGLISHPARHSEVSSAPYLSAVINEALRIHPGVGTIPERVVPRGGVELHGVEIPEGTIIGVHTWAVNRSKEIFGEDVECFRPERWIDNAPEKLQSMRKNTFTWGAGARGCIGKNVAMLQMLPIIVELYRHFDFNPADAQKDWHVSGTWITRQTQMDMIVSKKRQDKE